MVFGVRQLACDALDRDRAANLEALIEPTMHWITATVRGITADTLPSTT